VALPKARPSRTGSVARQAPILVPVPETLLEVVPETLLEVVPETLLEVVPGRLPRPIPAAAAHATL
jgi:hypothetical protein